MSETTPSDAGYIAERLPGIDAFRDRVVGALCRREAEHNLILGVAGNLSLGEHHYSDHDPELWAVSHGDEVVGAALRTPPFNLLVSSLPEMAAVEALASALSDAALELPGVVATVPVAGQFVATWQERTGQRMELSLRQGVYSLVNVVPPPPAIGVVRFATADDTSLLVEWIVAFGEEMGSPEVVVDLSTKEVARRLAGPDGGYVLWEDAGAKVSLVGYGGFTPNGARIGPVYTPPEWRGHGYASRATAFASQYLLDSGRRFCFLYTDLANPTSNKIYREIGYELVCESEEWRTAT